MIPNSTSNDSESLKTTNTRGHFAVTAAGGGINTRESERVPAPFRALEHPRSSDLPQTAPRADQSATKQTLAGAHKEPSAAEPSQTAPQQRRSLSKITRELTDEDLKSPALPKLLVEEIERLEAKLVELVAFRDRFYDSDKANAVLGEKLKRHRSNEIISIACLLVGAAALGFAPKVWSTQPAGWISLAFGVILVVGGIVARVVKA